MTKFAWLPCRFISIFLYIRKCSGVFRLTDWLVRHVTLSLPKIAWSEQITAGCRANVLVPGQILPMQSLSLFSQENSKHFSWTEDAPVGGAIIKHHVTSRIDRDYRRLFHVLRTVCESRVLFRSQNKPGFERCVYYLNLCLLQGRKTSFCRVRALIPAFGGNNSSVSLSCFNPFSLVW